MKMYGTFHNSSSPSATIFSSRATGMPTRSRTAARRFGRLDGLAYQSPPPS
jgi:hypothetical protein